MRMITNQGIETMATRIAEDMLPRQLKQLLTAAADRCDWEVHLVVARWLDDWEEINSATTPGAELRAASTEDENNGN